MKLGFFFGSFMGGGAEKMMINLARGFSDKGIETTIYVTTKEGPYSRSIPNSMHIHCFDAKLGVKSVIHKIRDVLKNDDLNALISTQLHINAAVALASIGLSKRPCLIFREATLPSRRVNSILKRLIFSYLYQKADKIVAISEGLKSDLQKCYGLDAKKVETIYNPVIHSTDNIFNEGTLHPWVLDKKLPVIIGMGRIHPVKDFKTLIKAISLVNKQQQTRLIIFGEIADPKYFQDLKELIQKRNLDEYVDFPGFVDNPLHQLTKADLFVLSSKFEGFGNVLVEAMSVGCPIVSTDCPYGPNEILSNGMYGDLVEVGNAQQMAASILENLDEGHDKKRLQNRASIFSLERALVKYEELIKSQNK